MAADVVALKPHQAPECDWRFYPDSDQHGPPEPLCWEFCLDRTNHSLEARVMDASGHVVATIIWGHETTTPGFDLRAAWERQVAQMSPLRH